MVRRADISAALGLLLAATPSPAVELGIRSVATIVHGPVFQDDFRRPEGIAVDARSGLFVVADTGNDRLAFFDQSGRYRGSVLCGREVRRPGTFEAETVSEPKCVSFDARGRMYIVDRANGDVEVRTALGAHLAWLKPEHHQRVTGICRPEAVSIGASGRIYVLYSGDLHEICVFDSDGALARSIDLDAEDPRRFPGPVWITVDADERKLVVVDPRAQRQIWIYDTEGHSQLSFGEHGEREGTFSIALHATWGPGDTLWITDAARHSISSFDSSGNYIGRIGGFGEAPGQFRYPAACAFLGPERIAVIERGGNRYQILDLRLPDRGPVSRTAQAARTEPIDVIATERRNQDFPLPTGRQLHAQSSPTAPTPTMPTSR